MTAQDAIDTQKLQQLFDRSRGFDALPFASPDAAREAGGDVRMVEFAALAAVGELGEFCNTLKKSIRQSAFGETPLPADVLVKELGDVQAYLYKLSSLLKRDLTEVHLETILRNCVRFAPRHEGRGTLVTVCGPPGSGKTTSVELAAKKAPKLFDLSYVEEYERNPHLPERSTDDSAISRGQDWFVNAVKTFTEKLPSAPPTVIFDQDPTAISLVYGRVFADAGSMTRAVYKENLQRLILVELMLAERTGARNILLLDAPVDVLVERSRAKKVALAINPDWIAAVRDRFHALYDNLPNVTRVDTSLEPKDKVADRIIAASGPL